MCIDLFESWEEERIHLNDKQPVRSNAMGKQLFQQFEEIKTKVQ
jgi:hypothetical protein